MKLQGKVLICLSALVDKLDIDVEALDISTVGKTNQEAAKEAGLKLVYLAFRRLHKAESELYALVSAYKGISVEEAEQTDAVALLQEIFQQEGVADFFK